MKNKLFHPMALSTALLLLGVPLAHADDTPNLQITGTIISRTCSVSADSQAMNVNLGNVGKKDLMQPGEGLSYVPFTIHLEKCGREANQVSVTFSGTANGTNPDLLAIGSDADAATGIAIAIYDQQKTLVPINTSAKATTLTPSAANVSLPFYARYLADGTTVRSGIANATATFSLAYD